MSFIRRHRRRRGAPMRSSWKRSQGPREFWTELSLLIDGQRFDFRELRINPALVCDSNVDLNFTLEVRGTVREPQPAKDCRP